MRATIYLDNAATTPLVPEVRAAISPYLAERFGNPSSGHPLGVRAAEALDEARRRVARALGARPAGVVFTSGGTEASNLAVLGFARARARHGRHLLIGPTEHPAVRLAAQALAAEGFELEEGRLDGAGGLDEEDFARRLRPDTVLVALMLVNNELGTRYPVERVARSVRARAPVAALHCDAVQAIGKQELSMAELGVDSLAISAHKIHGPKGAGALVLSEGVAPPAPILFGGGQEGGLRSGTENVPGIVGLGVAAELAAADAARGAPVLSGARAVLAERLARLAGVRVLEPGSERSAAILALLLPGPPAEVWMHHLEARGLMTSAGSACHAKTNKRSPTLAALGLSSEEALRVLRISFARTTLPEELQEAAEIFAAVASELCLGVR
jgi:cysteine desulfurase